MKTKTWRSKGCCTLNADEVRGQKSFLQELGSKMRAVGEVGVS